LQKIKNRLDKDKYIKSLEEQIVSLDARIDLLLSKIASLDKELSYYRTKKNSGNSSVPPSKDPYRVKRTESLRKPTDKKAGGQPGHKGSFLEQTETPDQIIIHQPDYCQCCGEDLRHISGEFMGKRQVIDIPPIVQQVTEHQTFGKRCRCGHVNEGAYPQEAHSSVCYGNNLQVAVAYFYARQYIPFERMREMFSDLFGISVSSGCLVNMIQKIADKATGTYETIRQMVEKSAVVGADETGTCINGKNHWSWVFQTPKATFIHTDRSRGKAVIDKLFPKGFPQTTLVHDCWAPYFKVHTGGHQICTAHLLRELKYLSKLYTGQTWTKDFTALLENALELKKELTPAQYLQPIPKRTTLETQFAELLGQTIDPKYEKLIIFRERMIKYKDYLFAFLYHWLVPADNNGSERAVRTFKVKQKVSGLFRSQEGARAFAIIRSLIDSTIKNAQNVMQMLIGATLLERAE